MAVFMVEPAQLPGHVRPVVANHLLAERATRAPDYRAEVRATTDVIAALVETPASVLERLSNALMGLTGADSAGVSLAGWDGGQRVFLWQAAVGLIHPFLGTVVKHDESPCGSVVDANALLLMVDPARVYLAAAQVEPRVREALLVPFQVDGRPVGTVWVISQSSKKFDAEDARVAVNVSKLAALAYQMLVKMGDLELLGRNIRLLDVEAPVPPAERPGLRRVGS